MLQEIAAEERVAEALGQGAAEVHRSARPRTGYRLVIGQVLEEAVGIGIVQRAVLAEALAVVRPLNTVVREVDAVGGKEEVAIGVERQPEQVAAPLTEQLEP